MNEIFNEYEYEIMCILISDQKKINECTLEEKHFATPFYRQIYPHLQSQYKDNGFIDFLQIENIFKGFMEWALECNNNYVTSAHLDYYIDKVEEQYKQRAYKKSFHEFQEELITFDELKQKLSNIDNEFVKRGTENRKSEDEIFELITRKNEFLDFSIFKGLSMRYGFIKNGIHIISARPGVGKSALAINFMNDLSRKYKCIYLNMEMNEQMIYQRMVSAESKVPVSQFSNLNETSISKVKSTIRNIGKRKYEVRNGSKSLNSIKHIISKESQNEHLILFVDYVGYVYTGKNQSDKDRIGEVTRELQLMTKDFNCTIFLLAQLNREGNDEPKLVYLKDSGELEQSAETVLFLHNPSRDINDQQPLYDVIIAKNRGGRLGKTQIKFIKECQKFEEVVYDNGMRK